MQQFLRCPIHKTQQVVEVCINDNLTTSRLACHKCHQLSPKDRQWISVDQLNGGLQMFLNQYSKASREYRLFMNEYLDIPNINIDEIIQISNALKSSIDALIQKILASIKIHQDLVNKNNRLIHRRSGHNDYTNIYQSTLKQTPTDGSTDYGKLDESINNLIAYSQLTDIVFREEFNKIQLERKNMAINISNIIDIFQKELKQYLQQVDHMFASKFVNVQPNVLLQSMTIKPQDATKFDQILRELLSPSQEQFLFQRLKTRISKFYSTEMKLIYKGTRDGLNSIKFQEMCFNKAPTLIIIHTNVNQIIGGVTEIPWQNYQSKRQPGEKGKNFLFSISKEEIYDLQNPQYAITCNDNKEYLSLKFNDDLIIRIPESSVILPTTLFSVLPLSYNLENKPLQHVNKQELKDLKQHLLEAINYNDKGLDYQRPRVNELWVYQLNIQKQSE